MDQRTLGDDVRAAAVKPRRRCLAEPERDAGEPAVFLPRGGEDRLG
jgi:hypothetical protein